MQRSNSELAEQYEEMYDTLYSMAKSPGSRAGRIERDEPVRKRPAERCSVRILGYSPHRKRCVFHPARRLETSDLYGVLRFQADAREEGTFQWSVDASSGREGFQVTPDSSDPEFAELSLHATRSNEIVNNNKAFSWAVQLRVRFTSSDGQRTDNEQIRVLWRNGDYDLDESSMWTERKTNGVKE